MYRPINYSKQSNKAFRAIPINNVHYQEIIYRHHFVRISGQHYFFILAWWDLGPDKILAFPVLGVFFAELLPLFANFLHVLCERNLRSFLNATRQGTIKWHDECIELPNLALTIFSYFLGLRDCVIT